MKNNNILILILLFNFFCLTAQNEESADEFMISASTLINENKFDDATIKLKKALIAFNKNERAYDSLFTRANLMLGKIYSKKRDLDSSEKYLKIAHQYKKKDSLQLETLTNLIDLYDESGDYTLALKSLKEALDLSIFLNTENSIKTAELYNYLGSIHLKISKINIGKTYFNKGLKSIEKLDENEKVKIDLLSGLANCLNYEGNYFRAIEQFYQILELQKNVFGKNYKRSILVYGSLAENYYALEDYEKAIIFQKKTINLGLELLDHNHPIFRGFYLNLGVYYNSIDDMDNAFLNYSKSLELFEESGNLNHPTVGVIQHALGEYYEKKGDPKLALDNYGKCISLWIKSLGKNHEYTAYGYLSRGDFYKNTGAFDLAISDLKNSLEIRKNIHDEPNDKITTAYIQLANCYTLNSNYNLAKENLSLGANLFQKDALSGFNFENVQNKNVLLEYFSARNNYLSSMNVKDKRYTDSVAINFKNSIKLLDILQEGYLSFSSKSDLLKEYFSIYDKYIEYSVTKKNDLNLAFELSEKTKSRRLTERFNQLRASYALSIPQDLLEKEQFLNNEIANYKEQIYSITLNKDHQNNSVPLKKIEDSLFTLQNRLQKLENTFKKEHPKYYQIRYSHDIVPVPEIQKQLNENETLIEYFVGKEAIYIFLISKETFKVHSVQKDFPLDKWITNLRNSICNYWSNPNAATLDHYNLLYQKTAFALYNKLIDPIASDLQKKLTIIPDASLSLIPFDALLTNSDDSTSYLIKKHQISYNYSATNYLNILKESKKKALKDFLAIAPNFKESQYEFFQEKRDLGYLKHNIDEVETIASFFDGTVLKNNEATKSMFLKKAKDYAIIHLSTHAKSNDKKGEYSYIVFQKTNNKSTPENNPNLLFADELYGLDLNAEMVVLSACETGIGEIKVGEGTVGLSHGFSYSGAKSTVTSLWNVNDSQTTKLMTLFYTNLKKGMPKDEALRKAKLTYIENESLSSPYFWAAFIPSGDMKPIEMNHKNNYLYYVIGIIAFLFIFLKLKKNKI